MARPRRRTTTTAWGHGRRGAVQTGVADIRNTKKVRQLAAQLRNECAARGVTLVSGEAEEILADRIRGIAQRLGVNERTVLDRYLLEDTVPALADALAAADTTYHQAVDAVEPVVLDITDTGRVIAALGMTMKLATEALQTPTGHADALGVATDCADAVVGIGAAIRSTDDEDIEIGGATLVYARNVLQRAVQLIHDGTWECPCSTPHAPGVTCTLQANLINDMNLLGGWAGGAHEPPAHHR